MIKEVFLMIMMTGGGDVPVDASFIEVENKTECEERAAKAIAVFPAASIKYVSHNCVSSGIRFDDFLHNPEPTGPQYFFDLKFSENGEKLISAKSYGSEKECTDAHGAGCIVAYQNLRQNLLK